MPRACAIDGRRIKADLERDGSIKDGMHVIERCRLIVSEMAKTSRPTLVSVHENAFGTFESHELFRVTGMSMKVVASRLPALCPNECYDFMYDEQTAGWPADLHYLFVR